LILVQTVSKDVAKAIQSARQKLGITQKDLAQVIEELTLNF
jgi:ribosome-binding protein aMBF1 (putative translation factor)